jgi:hypothetical protein
MAALMTIRLPIVEHASLIFFSGCDCGEVWSVFLAGRVGEGWSATAHATIGRCPGSARKNNLKRN